MPSNFETEFQASAWLQLIAMHGITATYYANGAGGGVSVSIIFRQDSELPGYYDDGETDKSLGTVTVSSADVTAPSMDDTFSIESSTWAVEGIEDQGHVLILTVTEFTRRRLGGKMTRLER